MIDKSVQPLTMVTATWLALVNIQHSTHKYNGPFSQEGEAAGASGYNYTHSPSTTANVW